MFTTTSVCCGGICAVAVITSTSVATFGDNVRINEARIDQPGSDLDEFFELAGPVGAPLDGLVYIVIGDGMAGNNGIVEEVTDLGGQSLDGSGLFVAAEATFGPGTADLITELNFENGDNVSHLLVAGFTGGVGDDLDLEDDGVLDVTPWASIVDGVALIGPTGPGDHVYCPTRVGPDGPGPPFHVYRCSPSMLCRAPGPGRRGRHARNGKPAVPLPRGPRRHRRRRCGGCRRAAGRVGAVSRLRCGFQH